MMISAPRESRQHSPRVVPRYTDDVLWSALEVQRFVGAMVGDFTFRFSPLGTADIHGFPFDKNWMDQGGGIPVPEERPDGTLPPVQLVAMPMLVYRGLNQIRYDDEFALWGPGTRMKVLAPWTFGGEEAEKVAWPGKEYDFLWHHRRQRAIRQEAEGCKRARGEKKVGDKAAKGCKR